jgi:hypothetical protein
LRQSSDLDNADLLGEVDSESSNNRGRSFATGLEFNWIVEHAPRRGDPHAP